MTKTFYAVLVLLILGACGPSCMSPSQCRETCAPAGVHYYGPVRGSAMAECICKSPNQPRPEAP